MDFNDFFEETENKKYGKYKLNSTVSDVFSFLMKPESVDKMILSSHDGRPALEGVIEDLEKKFPNGPEFDLKKDLHLRKMVGSMVKFVLRDFGYEVNVNKAMSKGSYIKTASQYRYNPARATKRIVKEISIEAV